MPDQIKRTTVRLSKDLDKAIKLRVAIDRKPMRIIIEEALWEWLQIRGHTAALEDRIERLTNAAGQQ
jgi:hypothetical protein|tara:strand:+ start:123 stop:323 length:201 start_codon:yes stop_codon:yes gene_type:complete